MGRWTKSVSDNSYWAVLWTTVLGITSFIFLKFMIDTHANPVLAGAYILGLALGSAGAVSSARIEAKESKS